MGLGATEDQRVVGDDCENGCENGWEKRLKSIGNATCNPEPGTWNLELVCLAGRGVISNYSSWQDVRLDFTAQS